MFFKWIENGPSVPRTSVVINISNMQNDETLDDFKISRNWFGEGFVALFLSYIHLNSDTSMHVFSGIQKELICGLLVAFLGKCYSENRCFPVLQRLIRWKGL